MYRAELYSIGKTKHGSYIVHLLVDYMGIEEEATFHYTNLADLPRYLFIIKNGKVRYRKGLTVWVSHPFEDGNGLTFQYLYEKNDSCNCEVA